MKGVKKTVPKAYRPIIGESHLGCYRDNGRRDLPTLLRPGYGRPDRCFKLARDKGFKYVGMQYRGECWAGNSYGKYGKLPDNQCNMKCRYDNSRWCGGGWKQNIFKLRVSNRPVPTSKPPPYKAIVGETRLGCYKDAGNRDLSTMISG